MSNLQISLAVLGFVVLALIIAYNSWSARRNAPKRADPVDEAQRDPSRHEPGMDTVGHGPDLTHSLREPVLGDFGSAAPGQSPASVDRFAETDAELAHLVQLDRKSTRLNSSHLVISYAVFCLKKKIISDAVHSYFPGSS